MGDNPLDLHLLRSAQMELPSAGVLCEQEDLLPIEQITTQDMLCHHSNRVRAQASSWA